jgi:hypothetical protein
MSIERALAIQGPAGPQELRWIADQASRRQCIVELGGGYGRITRALADHTPGHVYTVVETETFPKFTRNLEDHVISGKVQPLGLIQDLNLSLRPDMVFFGRNDCLEDDLRHWIPQTMRGGILVGLGDDLSRILHKVLTYFRYGTNTYVWYHYIR